MGTEPFPSPLFPPETPPRGPAGCCVSKHHALQPWRPISTRRTLPSPRMLLLLLLFALFGLQSARCTAWLPIERKATDESHCCQVCPALSCLAFPLFPPLKPNPKPGTQTPSPNPRPVRPPSPHPRIISSSLALPAEKKGGGARRRDKDLMLRGWVRLRLDPSVPISRDSIKDHTVIHPCLPPLSNTQTATVPTR